MSQEQKDRLEDVANLSLGPSVLTVSPRLFSDEFLQVTLLEIKRTIDLCRRKLDLLVCSRDSLQQEIWRRCNHTLVTEREGFEHRDRCTKCGWANFSR